MSASDPASILGLVHSEIEEAVAIILNEAEAALAITAGAQPSDAETTAALNERLTNIMRACMFQDLTGQRLVIVRDMLAGHGTTRTDAFAQDHLLNGPALPGDGLDQAAADALLSMSPATAAPV